MAEVKEILSLLQFNLPEGKELKDIDTSEIKEHFETNFVGMDIAHEKEIVRSKVLGKK